MDSAPGFLCRDFVTSSCRQEGLSLAVQPYKWREMQAQLKCLRALILQYRGRLEVGASRRTAAAYLQTIHPAEAEIAKIERRVAAVPHSGSTPPKALRTTRR